MKITTEKSFAGNLIGWVHFPSAEHLPPEARTALIGARAMAGTVLQVAFKAAGLPEVSVAHLTYGKPRQSRMHLMPWLTVHYSTDGKSQRELAIETLTLAAEDLENATKFTVQVASPEARTGFDLTPTIHAAAVDNPGELWLPPQLQDDLRQLGTRALRLSSATVADPRQV